MRIRKATPEDIPALLPLLRELFSFEEEFCFDSSTQRRGLELLFASGAATVYAVEQQGRLIASASLHEGVSTAMGAKSAWLEDVIVLPPYRGQGIGKELLEAVKADAKKRGIERISVLTDQGNVRAQRLYTGLGFCISPMVCMRGFI